MDFIFIMILAMLPSVLFIGMLIWVFYYNTKHTFMVDDLREHGGWITYQGVEYRIQRGADIEVGLGYIVVTNPNGERMRFTLGNAFTQQPVVRIERW